MSARTILSARISEMPKEFGDQMPAVYAVFLEADGAPGKEQKLFHFYPDEIGFTPEEFKGLTEKDAWALYRAKDKAFLQS